MKRQNQNRPSPFPGRICRRQLNLPLFFVIFCIVVHFFWLVNVCICCVRFNFSIPSQRLSWGTSPQWPISCWMGRKTLTQWNYIGGTLWRLCDIKSRLVLLVFCGLRSNRVSLKSRPLVTVVKKVIVVYCECSCTFITWWFLERWLLQICCCCVLRWKNFASFIIIIKMYLSKWHCHA